MKLNLGRSSRNTAPGRSLASDTAYAAKYVDRDRSMRSKNEAKDMLRPQDFIRARTSDSAKGAKRIPE
jgi:hypothetical protein